MLTWTLAGTVLTGCIGPLPWNHPCADPAALDVSDCECGTQDSDGDGTVDCEDACPLDPDKTEPGACGCGLSDDDCRDINCDPLADSDADGLNDCDDGCPTDFNKTSPGICGCGLSDADADNDGVVDDCDLPKIEVNRREVNLSLESHAQAIEIRNAGGGSLEYSVGASTPWLTVTPKTGRVAPGERALLFVDGELLDLAAGNYEAGFQIMTNVGTMIPIIIQATVAAVTPATDDTMRAATRTIGEAPLAVFFDAVDDGSGVAQPANEKYANWFYEWDFGDDDAGAWTTTGKSRNRATGYVAGHVYEKPGRYLVTLKVTDKPGSTRTYQQTIHVLPFGGLTFYVSSSTGNDRNDGLSPSGPLRTLDHAICLLGENRRLLLKRGDTWSTSKTYTLGTPGPTIIGAFSEDDGSDDPSKPKPRINFVGDGTFLRLGDQPDWRVCDLDIAGPGESSTGYAVEGFKSTSQTLFARLDITGFRTGFSWSIGASGHDQNFIVECDVQGMRNKSAFIGGSRCAVLGTRMITAGSHVLRVWYARKFVISECELLDPDPTGNASLKMHAKADEATPTEFVIVSGNAFRGDQWPVTLGPQNKTSLETVRQVVFERNHVTVGDDGRGLRSVAVFGPHITVRNNLFDGTKSAGDVYEAVSVEQRGVGPAPQGVRIYNNTARRTDGGMVMCAVVGDLSDVTIFNNLVVVPDDCLRKTRTVTGPATQSDNHIHTEAALIEAFIGDSPKLKSDTSAMIEMTGPVPGLGEDFNGTRRPSLFGDSTKTLIGSIEAQ